MVYFFSKPGLETWLELAKMSKEQQAHMLV